MLSSGFKALRGQALIRSLLLISPLFFLTVNEWTNVVVLFLSISALWFLLRRPKAVSNSALSNGATSSESRLIPWVLAGPLLAVIMGQLFRADFYPPNLDAPLRFVLCIPIYMALTRGWAAKSGAQPITLQWVQSVLPVTLIWTFLFTLKWPSYWGAGLTTYFVDPLSFGSYCLLFSFLSLAGLTCFWSEMSWQKRILSLAGIACGIYLSVASGSRTGWLNLPVFMLLWMGFCLKPRIGLGRTLFLAAVLLALIVVLLIAKPNLANKFILAYQEIRAYQWSAMNPDSSVTLRISFYRMGYFYFMEHPWSGWGDLGWMARMNAPELMVYASPAAREFPSHGFHNEIINSAVRSGVWGLVSSTLLFAVVIYRACRGLIHGFGSSQLIALMLLIFILHLLSAGMTTEVTNLVFLVSFIGLTLAVMLAEQGIASGEAARQKQI
jgi:O-antigen ligase